MKKRKRRTHSALLGGEVTKKDFVAIANMICAHGVPEGFTRALASYFGSQNPRFSQDRFVAATRKC